MLFFCLAALDPSLDGGVGKDLALGLGGGGAAFPDLVLFLFLSPFFLISANKAGFGTGGRLRWVIKRHEQCLEKFDRGMQGAAHA